MDIFKIDLNSPDPVIISRAATLIENGGIVVHPTDTTYGLAANAISETAVRKIYEIKGREYNKPLIVAVRDIAQAKTLTVFNDSAEKLTVKFFPGPLTLVLPKTGLVPRIVTGEEAKLGFRIPNNSVTLALSKICQVPYTTTSANPSGQPNPYSVETILTAFSQEALAKIDLILDAGPLPAVSPSTVVDLTGEKPVILRNGPITEEEIISTLS